MIKKALLLFVLSLVGLAVYLYFYLGAYKDPEISTGESGPLILLYTEHLGAYHQIGPKIEMVERWAEARGLNCARTFGEYLDDPSAVDQDRLRSRAGCVLAAPYSGETEDFTLETRPRRTYVIARYNGSPAIGPFTVYPKVFEYIQTQRLKLEGPTLEIYSVHGKAVDTEYLFPVVLP